MNNNFNISVIIPTYNRKHTLKRAITSVINQSYKPIEIIVVDDGSTDGTFEWINSEYPLIKLIQQLNSGVSSSRNTGINNAIGNWIALLDSDDEWKVNKLEKQVKSLEKQYRWQ